MKAIVISDDLTGAAEVAGAALRLGASAEVHIGGVYNSKADVVAIDADTRSLSPSAAARVASRLTKQVTALGGHVLIKKVDSVLRGPVLAELDAILTVLGLDRCLLVCGNPRKRRFLLNGHIHLDSVPLHTTDFAFDPEHPRASSNAIDLLRSGSRFEGQVSTISIDRTDRNLRVVNPGESLESGVSVGNVCSSEQLQLYAQHWIAQRESVLVAGAAEFIEAILLRCIGKRSNSIAERNSVVSSSSGDRMLLVSGTRNPHDDGWPVVRIQEARSVAENLANVDESLKQEGRVAIRAVNALASSPESLLHRLTQVAKQAIVQSSPHEVWVEGGRTASTLFRELGYERLTALSNLGDGTVALRATQKATPLFVVKPGSYPWPKVDRPALRSDSVDRWRDTA